jgi:hydrogenase nickel incorporation protein HypA/HybF
MVIFAAGEQVMHELTLAESVIGIVESVARKSRASKVLRVNLAIGALAHIEPETLQYCCALVARDTLAEGASFEIERTPGRAWCGVCLQEHELSTPGTPCPTCGGYQLTITGGDEMQVMDIAVE